MTESESFKFKVEITGKTRNADNKNNVEIAAPLKFLSNFWRTLEVLLINCQIKLILTWSEDCVISSAVSKIKSKITDTKLYVPVVTLSTQDNAKLLEKLNSGFKRQLIGTDINQKFHQKGKINI